MLFSVEIGRDSAMIEFAQSTEGKDQVDAAEVSRIINRGGAFVKIVDDLVEILTSVNGTVVIETGKIDVYDMLPEFVVLGEPYFDRG